MNIGQFLASQVATRPTKAAVVDGSFTISYWELDHQASLLAQKLRRLSSQEEEIVLLLMPPGINNIICQAAIVYMGGTCANLDPNASDGDLQAKADFLKAQILITDHANAGRYITIPHRIQYEHEMPLEDPGEPLLLELPVPVAPDYRSHIFFTSGTTGIPKCVQVPGRALLLLRDSAYTSEDRFGNANNTCFDGSLFDIWVPLIIGATVVIIRRDVILDPPQFANLLENEAVTVILLTASLLATVAASCPTAFRGCRTVLTAGETPNTAAVREILAAGPPERLLNAYGPTETGIFVMTHEIRLEDTLKGEFPVGYAIEGVKVELVDQSFNTVHGQGTGEILLGGPGLSRGYYLDPSKTSNAFVDLPDTGKDGKMARFYRTGDIGERDEQGRMFWRGRKNNEIKHHGYRINLDVIEAELCKLDNVALAVTFKLEDPESKTSWIVACVVTREPDQGFRETCQREAISRLPKYMVPQIVCLDRLPVSANGKTDRHALASQLLNHRRRLGAEEMSMNGSRLSETEEKLRTIWRDCLGAFSLDDIGPDSDFSLLGANSLDVTASLSRVRQLFGVSMPAHKLYENPKLRGFAAEIEQQMTQTSRSHENDLKARLLCDTHLADNLEIGPNAVSDWTSNDEGNVLVTGVTGFVGAFLLKALVEMPAVKEVKCLVRASSSGRGRQRILDTLDKYRILTGMPEEHLAKIVPVCGNITQPALGLDDESFRELAARTSVIFHLAAHVDYVQPYSAHRKANVLGTLHILQLATTARVKPVHYASSAATFGPTGLSRPGWISEDEDIQPFLDLMPFEMGYGQSKWVVEVMMRRVMNKGLPATVHRPGFVLFDRTTGIGNADDFVGRFVTDVFALGAYPDLPANRKEITTIDHVVSTMLLASSSPENLGRVYHVVPDAEDVEDMCLARFREVLENVTGRRLEQLPYNEWVARVVEADGKRRMRLSALIPMLEEKVMVHRTRWEAYEGMGRLRTDNVKEARARAGLSEVLTDSGVTEAEVARYLAFLEIPVMQKE